jgi:hypothetical protein
MRGLGKCQLLFWTQCYYYKNHSLLSIKNKSPDERGSCFCYFIRLINYQLFGNGTVPNHQFNQV